MTGLQEAGTRKICVSDNFVVDLEGFSNGMDKEFASNSRFTRGISRKGGQRGGDRKIGLSPDDDERDALVSATSTARAVGASSTPEKLVSPRASDQHMSNQVPQHQITIKAPNISTTVPVESRLSKRHSFRQRSPPSWFSDPKRILLFFATLSSLGSLMLIFFTLFMNKASDNNEGALGWQQ